MAFQRSQRQPTATSHVADDPAQASASPRAQLRRQMAEMTYDQQAEAVRPRDSAPVSGGIGPVQRLADPNVVMKEEAATSGNEKPKTAKIILSARAGGNPFTSDFWQNLNVGHAWIDIQKPNGRPDSWGFTVADYSNFPKTQPWKSVEGMVLHPDGSSGATGALPEPIDEDQLKKGEEWAEGQRGRQYNLFGFNCAKFSIGMYEATTGKKAPAGLFGAMIANPSSLSGAINKHVEKLEKKTKNED